MTKTTFIGIVHLSVTILRVIKSRLLCFLGKTGYACIECIVCSKILYSIHFTSVQGYSVWDSAGGDGEFLLPPPSPYFYFWLPLPYLAHAVDQLLIIFHFHSTHPSGSQKQYLALIAINCIITVKLYRISYCRPFPHSGNSVENLVAHMSMLTYILTSSQQILCLLIMLIYLIIMSILSCIRFDWGTLKLIWKEIVAGISGAMRIFWSLSRSHVIVHHS